MDTSLSGIYQSPTLQRATELAVKDSRQSVVSQFEFSDLIKRLERLRLHSICLAGSMERIMDIKRVKNRTDVPPGAPLVEVRNSDSQFIVSVEIGDNIPSYLDGPFANAAIAVQQGIARAEGNSITLLYVVTADA